MESRSLMIIFLVKLKYQSHKRLEIASGDFFLTQNKGLYFLFIKFNIDGYFISLPLLLSIYIR